MAHWELTSNWQQRYQRSPMLSKSIQMVINCWKQTQTINKTVIRNTFVSESLVVEWELCNFFWPSAEQPSQKKLSSLLASSTVMSIQAGWNLNKKYYAEDGIHSAWYQQYDGLCCKTGSFSKMQSL